MNSKIFNLLRENLCHSFSLAKHAGLIDQINKDTVISDLPWTPVRYQKFRQSVEKELELEINWSGTLENIVDEFDRKYSARFFGQMWKPRTESYVYTGWNLIDEINQQNPQSVLDVGCGYHPFKNRIHNLIGIDPYNNCADYMIDILEYSVPDETHDHIIALGSINFNSFDDISARFGQCVRLLSPGGKLYMRCNPGISWPKAPYVDIFPWSFQTAYHLADTYRLKLQQIKKDYDRLALLYIKA